MSDNSLRQTPVVSAPPPSPEAPGYLPSTDAPGTLEDLANLRDAIHRVRLDEAQWQDVVVELQDAERTRLQLLRDELAPIEKDIPPNADLFEFVVSPGNPPRLWIDMIAHVVMGRDRKTFRFVRDTRLGREVLLETADRARMQGAIIDYVARRIVEREKLMATIDGGANGARANDRGGTKGTRPFSGQRSGGVRPAPHAQGPKVRTASARTPTPLMPGVGSLLLAFLCGVVAFAVAFTVLRAYWPGGLP